MINIVSPHVLDKTNQMLNERAEAGVGSCGVITLEMFVETGLEDYTLGAATTSL